jgi:hypothetical protein
MTKEIKKKKQTNKQGKSNVLHFTFQKILNYEIFKRETNQKGAFIMNQLKYKEDKDKIEKKK